MDSSGPLISLLHVKKYFQLHKSMFTSIVTGKKVLARAVDDVTLEVKQGEILGLVGESGSGKTTIGFVMAGLTSPTGGTVLFKGVNITELTKQERKNYRQKVQVILQNPYESLNPRMNIFQIVAEPLIVARSVSNQQEIRKLVKSALDQAELDASEKFFSRYPRSLSGGQRQRVSFARALVTDPELIIADEPVSMLDTSVRSDILKLMLKMRNEKKVSFLFITHDFAVARYVCDRVVVLYLGKSVEIAPTELMLSRAMHPYTAALLEATPNPNPVIRNVSSLIHGEVPSATNPPEGCRFHPRCPRRIEICNSQEPPLTERSPEHSIACHNPMQSERGSTTTE